MVPFGLSVGDLVVGGLIRKIFKALKDSGVTTSEYQDELESLSMILKHLETLCFTETVQASYANPIRRLAQNCQVPLEAFLERIESFKESLGVRSQRNTSAALLEEWNGQRSWRLRFRNCEPWLQPRSFNCSYSCKRFFCESGVCWKCELKCTGAQ